MRLLSADVELLRNYCPSIMLERSVASSDLLLQEHAPNLFLAADVATVCVMAFHSGSHAIMKHMFGRILTTITVAALIGLIVLLQSASPSTAGPLGILAVFLLLYIVCVGVVTLLIAMLAIAYGMIRRRKLSGGEHDQLVKHAYYYGTLVALAPVMLVGMSSVGRVGGYELVLVVLFTVIGVFYIQKRL